MSKLSYLIKALFLGVALYFLFDSHIISDSLKIVVIVICILLLFSPRTWFCAKTFLLKLFKPLKKSGAPDQNKLNILIMLFRIRCLEIYDLYTRLRYKQEEAKNDNWILLHLREMTEFDGNVDFYSETNKSKIKKNKAKADTVFYKRFDFENIHITDERIRNTTDLEITFFHSSALQKLMVIRSFGLFKNELDTLIKNYQFLDDTYCSHFDDYFGDFFINRIGKEQRRDAYRSIKISWNNLISILKAYLIYFENCNGMQDLTISLFKEIEVLETLTSDLSFAFRQKNAIDNQSSCTASKEALKQFFDKMNANFLWCKSFL